MMSQRDNGEELLEGILDLVLFPHLEEPFTSISSLVEEQWWSRSEKMANSEGDDVVSSVVFDLLREECDSLPSYITADIFYDPTVMILLALLA